MTVEARAEPRTRPARPAPSSESTVALDRFCELLGASPPMKALYGEIERVAATDATVLIVGESGTGKELVARSLHRMSHRGERDFIAVNCGAIPHHLLEAELFGHEKGSFTGAHQQHAGYFERASGGTLFLDEVTEMAPDMQVKLLRVLETGRFHRVGGTQTVQVDVRIVAATNKDPREAALSGAFRDDLLYRLAVFPIRVPPLRDRGSDVVGLAQHFLDELNAKSVTSKRFARRAYDALAGHRWPGNVRELRNAVQRGYILADDEIELPDPVVRAPRRSAQQAETLDVSIGTALADAQRAIILATLSHFDGDKGRTAAALGVSLKTLYNRLARYDAKDTGREAPFRP